MEKETKRGNGIQEAKSSILFISTRIWKGFRQTSKAFFLFNFFSTGGVASFAAGA